MKKENRSLIWGVLLIIIGFLFLGQNLDLFYLEWEGLWPILMIVGGLFFWLGWLFNRREYGLLMPGTILLVYGLMFQYSAWNGWYYMDSLWPGFLLGPGLGFFFMYIFGTREKGMLVPAVILIGLALLFWAGRDSLRLLWPALIIAVGIYLLVKSRRQKESALTKVEERDTQEIKE